MAQECRLSDYEALGARACVVKLAISARRLRVLLSSAGYLSRLCAVKKQRARKASPVRPSLGPLGAVGTGLGTRGRRVRVAGHAAVVVVRWFNVRGLHKPLCDCEGHRALQFAVLGVAPEVGELKWVGLEVV